jgi:hypothetical protein
MDFSLETLELLCEVLAQVTLSAAQEDFDESARRVGNARRELIEAVASAQASAVLFEMVEASVADPS